MAPYDSLPAYEHGQPGSLGVLLVNLGTPDAPTTGAVRRYLARFLADPRVVELPRWLWRPILHGYILRVRPRRSAAAYRRIWTEHGSPLLLYSQQLAVALERRLSSHLPGRVHVALGMSYGEPGIERALATLYERRLRRLIVLPLYPQYSGSTTGSVFEAVSGVLSRRRWIPELRFVNHYHDASGYIAALATTIRRFREDHGSGERLLFSFHGLPRSMLEAGDPYHCQCLKTARLVAEALALPDEDWHIAFQSRVGRAEWLKPYCDQTLKDWGAAKLGTVDVVCPGFAVDCLETLEEIAMQNAERYRAAGGGELRYIPALNASDEHVAFLARLIEKNVAGWPEASLDADVTAEARALEQSRRRALDLGAQR